MKKSRRLDRESVSSRVVNRITASKFCGALTLASSSVAGLFLTVTNSPEHFFNTRALIILLGSSALSVMESDFAKKDCLQMVAKIDEQENNRRPIELSSRENFFAKYGSSVAVGLGTTMALETSYAFDTAGLTAAPSIGMYAVSSAALLTAGYAGFRRRDEHLSECEAQLQQQIPAAGVMAEPRLTD